MKKTLTLIAIIISIINAFSQSITLEPTAISNISESTTEDIIIARAADNVSRATPFIIGKSANGSIASPTAIKDDKRLLFLGGRGHTGTEFGLTSKSSILFNTTQNWTTTANGTNIEFYTTAQNTVISSNRMTINHNGNVGIGVIGDATAKLQVNGDFALSGESGYSEGNENPDINRNGASVIRAGFGQSESTSIGGITGGTQGLIVYIKRPKIGPPGQPDFFTIKNEDPDSESFNRIITHTGNNISRNTEFSVILIYDGVAQRWRVIGI